MRQMNCGVPIRLQVEPGDIVVMHSQLGTSLAPNSDSQMKASLQFRLEHVVLDELIDDFNRHELPFVGFEGLRDILGSSKRSSSTQ